MEKTDRLNQITISENATREEMGWLQEQLDHYRSEQTQGAYDQPGVEINLVIKDREGSVVGGVSASTVLGVMHLEVLWVADELRKLGFGRDLVLGAEKLGYDQGCISAQTMTFSFQAPGFYQKIGYKLLGVYDGYAFGITESVLRKRLSAKDLVPIEAAWQARQEIAERFSFTSDVTPEDLEVLRKGLHSHVVENVGDKYKGIHIGLAAKDAAGQLVGGLDAFTTLQNMILEGVWVDERCRGIGLGAKLLTSAENIAQQNGCIAAFTYVLSFLAPAFFHELGYQNYAVSDAYPEPYREYYMIKRFD